MERVRAEELAQGMVAAWARVKDRELVQATAAALVAEHLKWVAACPRLRQFTRLTRSTRKKRARRSIRERVFCGWLSDRTARRATFESPARLASDWTRKRWKR